MIHIFCLFLRLVRQSYMLHLCVINLTKINVSSPSLRDCEINCARKIERLFDMSLRQIVLFLYK